MADADLTPHQSKSKPGRESNERKWPGNLPKISLLFTLLFFFFAFCLEIKSFHRLPLHTDLDVSNHDNVLQKHVAFFDRNNDGLVYPWETFQGFRAIGANLFLSTVSAFFINIGLSSKTSPNKFPSPLFPIVVKNIHLGKHGSDSGVYDSEGRFVPSKFEEIFEKHSRTHPNALTEEELKSMLKANREPKDFMGWFASFTEWKTLYNLCKDKNGLLQKETIKAVYDGSLFKQMEEERASSKLKK